MECPLCGGEMEPGLIHTRPVVWSKEKRRLVVVGASKKTYTIWQTYCETFKCKNCGALLVNPNNQ